MLTQRLCTELTTPLLQFYYHNRGGEELSINKKIKNKHSPLDSANNECYITNRTKVTRIHQKVINTPDRPVVLYIDDCIVGRRYDL